MTTTTQPIDLEDPEEIRAVLLTVARTALDAATTSHKASVAAGLATPEEDAMATAAQGAMHALLSSAEGVELGTAELQALTQVASGLLFGAALTDALVARRKEKLH